MSLFFFGMSGGQWAEKSFYFFFLLTLDIDLMTRHTSYQYSLKTIASSAWHIQEFFQMRKNTFLAHQKEVVVTFIIVDTQQQNFANLLDKLQGFNCSISSNI